MNAEYTGDLGLKKLGLGTVQFGVDYGVSNNDGIPELSEIREILTAAANNHVQIIDTASSYGKSEVVLGQLLPEDHHFRIVTKTPQFTGPLITNDHVQQLEEAFCNSLANLGQDSLYGLLIHDADNLLAEDGARLFDKMLEFKVRGLLEKVGVSIYTAAQIDQLMARYDLDIIQLPLNILDQRLIRSGHLQALKESGNEIHARSIFLQGLLLMNPDELPPYFNPIAGKLKQYHAFLSNNALTPIQAALNFVLAIEETDYVFCGVTKKRELLEIIENVDDAFVFNNFEQFAIPDPTMVDPSKWRLE